MMTMGIGIRTMNDLRSAIEMGLSKEQIQMALPVSVDYDWAMRELYLGTARDVLYKLDLSDELYNIQGRGVAAY